MINRHLRSSTIARAMLGATLGGGGVALAQSTGRTYCYTPQPYGVTMDCDDCQLYSLCPSAVLCTLSSTGGGPDPIITSTVSCSTFVGGTGDCAEGTCAGGTPVVGQGATTVTIPTQTCTTNCIRIQPVPK